jgi:UDP-N-acetylmuramyl pentapeptide phosphotransferase/UDP-N-acetylglucosamine-1-phosphate transferase
MLYFSFSCIVSFACIIMLMRFASLKRFFADNDLKGPQKFHKTPVPRVGGLAVYVGLVAVAIYINIKQEYNLLFQNLIICAFPVFILGFTEDITKAISPKKRLIAACISAALFIYLTQSYIIRMDIAYIDQILHYKPIAYIITIFAVCGMINAINIIDGFNGLVSMVANIMFLSIAYIAWRLGDINLALIAFSCIGAICGFFIFNFPKGFIFLGDGGAYLIGFMLAQMAIYLVYKHPQVSAWYPCLLFIYPIFETIFSIYRRRFLKGVPSTMPDGIHLHTLVYRRLIRWMVGANTPKHITQRNALTSPYLWLISAIGVLPATLFYDSTWKVQLFCFIFIVIYVWLYARIIHFKSPKWLIVKRCSK